MERRVRRAAAAALSCAFLVAWAVCQVLLGTATGAAQPALGAPPAVAAPAAPAAPAAVRLGPAGAEVRRTADHRPGSDVVQRRAAAAEPGVRLPAFPPAALPAARTDAPGPRPGLYAAGPRQERAPPSDHYDPRHTRGPPSTRSS
ncbi:hypothetical protein ABTX81_27875 [Kitasatospora sp. NPDC097605]|uniref:hypothetical protein n=1 Tax=Kitasatospora sp. NPDC097605 TaxID=3157226 RepID=UPI00331E5468